MRKLGTSPARGDRVRIRPTLLHSALKCRTPTYTRKYLPPSFFTSYRSWQRSPNLCCPQWSQTWVLDWSQHLFQISIPYHINYRGFPSILQALWSPQALRGTSMLVLTHFGCLLCPLPNIHSRASWSLMVTWFKLCSMLACIIANNLLGAAYALNAWSRSPVLEV